MSDPSSQQPLSRSQSGSEPGSQSGSQPAGQASAGDTSHSPSQPARPARLPLGATPVQQGPLPESRAWNAVSTMLSGLLGFGVPGYLVDRWLGTNGLLTLLGLVLGMAAALTVIWFRYGTQRS